MNLSKTMQDLSIGSDAERGDTCAACEADGKYQVPLCFVLNVTSQFAGPV